MFLALATLIGLAVGVAPASIAKGSARPECFPDCDGAHLEDGGFDRMNLSHGQFSGAHLARAGFAHAFLGYVNFRGADLRHARMKGAIFLDEYPATLKWHGPADPYAADPASAADLRAADLRGADARGAHLAQVDLTGADLRGADLSGAYLQLANLRHARLSGANLTGVRWGSTTCPDGSVTEHGCATLGRSRRASHSPPF